MISLSFSKNPVQVSEKTGKPYSRNVRYDEQDTTYFGQLFPPKRLWTDQGVEPPETLTVTYSS